MRLGNAVDAVVLRRVMRVARQLICDTLRTECGMSLRSCQALDAFEARRPPGSGTGAVSLVCALEPDRHPGWGLDGDQSAKKPITAALGGNVMLQTVRAARRDDLVDLISCIKLELPAETLRVGRLFG